MAAQVVEPELTAVADKIQFHLTTFLLAAAEEELEHI
jgi:hypothetical protein